MSLQGIDISQWQATTPPLDGLSFVFVRATYGTGYDTRYAQHAANVQAAGLVLGAYGFGINGDGAAQAQALLRTAPDADFYALDLEAEPGKPPMTAAQARAFIAEMHRQGRKVGLYHSLSGYPSDALGADWRWVAAWVGIDPGADWTFHQDAGGPIDHDVFAGDAAALASFVASQEVIVATKPAALTPSAEPVVYAGLITSLILAGIQLLVGQGMLTSDQATQLNPQAATIANALVTLLPVIAALITRQTVWPNAKVVSNGDGTASPKPAVIDGHGTGVILDAPGPAVTTSRSGVNVISSTTLPSGTTGTIGANTKRWALDGSPLLPVGPSILAFAAVDVLSGVLTGHFYLTATDHPYYVRWQDITWPTAASSPAAPAFGWTADGLKERISPDAATASALPPYKPWLPAVDPVTDVSGLFIPIDPAKLDQTLDPAGTPGYPHGIAFTWRQAIDWWAYTFAHPVDLTFVEPGLLPGSKVLTPMGYKLAVSLSVVGNSNQFAPASYNPLGLPVL